MALTVTITGTRSVDARAAADLGQEFDRFVRPFARPDTHFYLGGAVGIDTLALDWLAERTAAAITVVVACAVADQPASAVEAIRGWDEQGRLAGLVELCASRLGTSAYHARNRWMVDRSAFVVGFPRGEDRTSGTWYTLDYAAGQGKPRLIVPVPATRVVY